MSLKAAPVTSVRTLPRIATRPLARPTEERHAAVLAFLADGEAWSGSALALALGASQRTVQRALKDLATAGNWAEALKIYRWYTPLLHLDTHVKLVQYIKLAASECGYGTETTRAPRLPIIGKEREEVLSTIRKALES